MKRGLSVVHLLLLLSILMFPEPVDGRSSGGVYTVTVYGDEGFTAFVSDVDTMFREGSLFAVEVRGGRLARVALATSHHMSKIALEEQVILGRSTGSTGRILYEFSGYVLRASLDSSTFLQTAMLQGQKLFLHTICSSSNFTILFTFFNSSSVNIDNVNSFTFKPVIIVSRNQELFSALVLQRNLVDVVVEAVDVGTRVVVKSHYSCLTLIGFAKRSLIELFDTLNSLSFEKCYEHLEESARIYGAYISMLPAVSSNIKQLNDLYYTALYNRLNTIFYPDVYGLSQFHRLIAYTMSIEMALPFNTTATRRLVQHIFDRVKPATLREVFMYLEIARLTGDADKIAEICSAAPYVSRESRDVVELFIKNRVEQMCGMSIDGGGADLSTADLSSVDMLALSQLKVVEVLQSAVLRGIEPSDPWRCLAFVSALQLSSAHVHEILPLFSLSTASYPCIDYAILKGMAGIDITEGELRLRPSIPKGVDALNVRIAAGGREIDLNYSGCGKDVKSVRLNGRRIDAHSIPLNSLLGGVNTIHVEMSSPALVTLEIAVLRGGVALEGIPVYLDVSGLGVKYSAVSVTDGLGRAVFSIPPDSFVTISINATGIGLLQLRTRVYDGDREMLIDLSRDYDSSRQIIERISTLEERLRQIEYEVRQATPSVPDYVDRTNTLFSSISLLASIVAIALAVSELRRW
ncbi:MAG: hypothetical protein N3D82_02685 [Ignisphaera sp.]|nr:hypothetical protein [Ignisphaera sp.]MCX8167925.1 hypothetical protein [Ignisphaera sp.]MDW8086168.1 hypothetical protein [Ignisphaera sp.]